MVDRRLVYSAEQRRPLQAGISPSMHFATQKGTIGFSKIGHRKAEPNIAHDLLFVLILIKR